MQNKHITNPIQCQKMMLVYKNIKIDNAGINQQLKNAVEDLQQVLQQIKAVQNGKN